MLLVRQTNPLPVLCGMSVTLFLSRLTQAADSTKGYYPGDLGQALAVIVVFVLLLLILRKWAWKPIVTQLRRREQDILESLEAAQRREREASQLLDHYKARLERAEAEAQQLLDNTRQEAEKIRAITLDSARAEAERSAERARADLERAKQHALRELRDATAEMASEIAGKVIRRELSPEDKKRLLEQSLEEIKKRASQE